MITGGYRLDLYCRNNWLVESGSMQEKNAAYAIDTERHGKTKFQLFTGQSFSECKKAAIRRGWKFHSDDDVTCPMCVKANSRSET